MTHEVTTSFLARNPARPEEVLDMIASVHATLLQLAGVEPAPQKPPPRPAVPVAASVNPNFVTCLECGRRLKALRFHLDKKHSLDPPAYRAKWALPRDYPMAAPSLAARRSALAVKSDFGRYRGPRGKKRQRANVGGAGDANCAV
jgi:predicted transcriptional regulator